MTTSHTPTPHESKARSSIRAGAEFIGTIYVGAEADDDGANMDLWIEQANAALHLARGEG